MNKRWFLPFLLCAVAVIAAVTVPQPRITPTLKTVPITEPATEATFSVTVLEYTPAEADALLERFAEERREAERKAEQRRETERTVAYDTSATYSAAYFRRMGVIYWGAWRWTWYSERVLPGGGLRIPGRHTDSNGYVRDEDGYICLAADSLSYGAVISTPFGGYGKVYDSGCGLDTIDVYVGW